MSPETPVANELDAGAVSAPTAVNSAQVRSAFGDTLHCPRCDYNLRGLTGNRCPECGLTLDWDAIIRAVQRRLEVPTFECQWRERPVASFFGTLWLSIQPWKIWRRIPLTADPRPGSLLLFVAATLPMFMIAMLFLFALSDLGTWYFVRFYRGRSYPVLQLFATGNAVLYFLNSNGVRYLLLFCLGLFVYGALCLFQRSLLGYRVRHIHLLRIAVLVFACLYTVQVLNDTLRGLMNTFTWFYRSWNSPWYYIYRVIDLAFLVLPTWSITRAARDYLQVRRPWQFGLVILALGCLVALTTHVVYCVLVDDFQNALTSAGGDMWPGLGFAGQWISWGLGFP